MAPGSSTPARSRFDRSPDREEGETRQAKGRTATRPPSPSRGTKPTPVPEGSPGSRSPIAGSALPPAAAPGCAHPLLPGRPGSGGHCTGLPSGTRSARGSPGRRRAARLRPPPPAFPFPGAPRGNSLRSGGVPPPAAAAAATSSR